MYAQALFEFQAKEIGVLKKEIISGLGPADLKGGSGRAIFKYRPALRAQLIEIMTRVRNFGKGQVQQELRRQQG